MKKRFVIVFMVMLISGWQVSAQHYVVLKDTTDSNSIMHKVQELKEIEVRRPIFESMLRAGNGGVAVDLSSLRKLGGSSQNPPKTHSIPIKSAIRTRQHVPKLPYNKDLILPLSQSSHKLA